MHPPILGRCHNLPIFLCPTVREANLKANARCWANEMTQGWSHAMPCHAGQTTYATWQVTDNTPVPIGLVKASQLASHQQSWQELSRCGSRF